ncbi:MAG: hypothetical protein NTV43_08090, partial [Methylococcales bacterium]|nr:hypothetical protein [Methylococcales bacterium]
TTASSRSRSISLNSIGFTLITARPLLLKSLYFNAWRFVVERLLPAILNMVLLRLNHPSYRPWH